MTASADITEARPFSNGSEADHWESANCRRCLFARPDDWMDMDDVPCPMQRAIWYGWITGTVPTMLATEYGASVTLQGRYPGVYRAWSCGPGMGNERWAGCLPDTDSEPVEEFTAFCEFPAECPNRVPGEAS